MRDLFGILLGEHEPARVALGATHRLRLQPDRQERGPVDVTRTLEKEELKAFFQLGMCPEDEELVNIMIDEADLNNDGIISCKEFKMIMNVYTQNLVKD